MASLNKLFLMGNLTRDPELRYIPSGTAVCEMGMAINNSYTTQGGEKKDDTVFVDVTAWGKTAENCSKYMSKGKPCLVEGRLRFESWDDKSGGGKRSKLTVTAEKVTFLGSKDDNPTAGGAQQSQPQQQQGAPAPQHTQFDDNFDVQGDDIPF